MNTREEWLIKALDIVRFHILGMSSATVPTTTRVSCGFPGGASRKAIGQCWSTLNSADGSTEIFISPVLSDAARVLDVLVHEAVHAAVGVQHGHKRPFASVARLCGLEGKMTATVASPELKTIIAIWIQQLGSYPHATLSMSTQKKQSTRMVKCECGACGYIARTSMKWIDKVGAPYCSCTDDDGEKLQMVVQITEEDGE